MDRWRSLLFVPATDKKRLKRAHERGADGVILDLEDAIPASAKDEAREAISPAVARLRKTGADVLVRINGTPEHVRPDLEAAVTAGVAAVIAPKVSNAEQVKALDAIMSDIEAAAGHGPIGLIALIEEPAALEHLSAISAFERIVGLALGSEDYCAHLGAPPGRLSLDLPCQLIAAAAARRRLMAFGAPISIGEFRDLAAYSAAVEVARGMGLNGALCIHPAQIKVANACYMPCEAERAEAERILEAWDEATAAGQGVTSVNGRMIDQPVVDRARRILAQS